MQLNWGNDSTLVGDNGSNGTKEQGVSFGCTRGYFIQDNWDLY
jgi:hypothetical protein